MSDYRPTPEILEIMLRKANEKLMAAKKFQELGFYSDASSRAYYAAFHAASAILANHGFTFSSHAQTLGAFNREFVKTGVFPPDSFGKLRRLFKNRQSADYDLNTIIDGDTAEQDVKDAEWLVNECRKYIEKSTGISFKI